MPVTATKTRSDPSNPSDDGSPQGQDEAGIGQRQRGLETIRAGMPASHDPCGTGEVMDADERRDDNTGEIPASRR